MATKTRMTVKEYYEVPIERDWTQLVGGELMVNDLRPIHAVLQWRIASRLVAWTHARSDRGMALPSTYLLLGDHDLYAPDVVWIAARHKPRDLHVRLERIPELCVEVRSPSTWPYDVGRKKAVYEDAGLPELWLVDDHAETVLVFRRSQVEQSGFDVALELGPSETLASPQLPGFELALDDLFAPV